MTTRTRRVPLRRGVAHWSGVRRRPRPAADAGASSVELVVITPLVIVMLLTMIALGRYSHSRQLVDEAASSAARAAAVAGTRAGADRAARDAVTDALQQAGLSCQTVTVLVDVNQFRAGGSVGVTVGCTADLSRLALAGVPGSVTVSAQARAALETYRDVR